MPRRTPPAVDHLLALATRLRELGAHAVSLTQGSAHLEAAWPVPADGLPPERASAHAVGFLVDPECDD